MLTRFQRGLRLLIALMALSCGVLGAAEPVAAAPSCYPAALGLPSQAVAARREVARTVPPSAAGHVASKTTTTATEPTSFAAPALLRAPRLYLRHCVLLR